MTAPRLNRFFISEQLPAMLWRPQRELRVLVSIASSSANSFRRCGDLMDYWYPTLSQSLLHQRTASGGPPLSLIAPRQSVSIASSSANSFRPTRMRRWWRFSNGLNRFFISEQLPALSITIGVALPYSSQSLLHQRTASGFTQLASGLPIHGCLNRFFISEQLPTPTIRCSSQTAPRLNRFFISEQLPAAAPPKPWKHCT